MNRSINAKIRIKIKIKIDDSDQNESNKVFTTLRSVLSV